MDSLRELVIEAVGRDTAINMRTNKSASLPYEIVDLSGGTPVLLSSWADYDEAHEQLYHAIAARRADAAIAAIEASGCVVVPVEPTEEMVAESHRAWDRTTLPGPFTIERLYRAALAARPRYVAPTDKEE